MTKVNLQAVGKRRKEKEEMILINRVMHIIGCPKYHIERMDLALDCFQKNMYDLVHVINQLDDGWHWTNESKSRVDKFCTRNPQIM